MDSSLSPQQLQVITLLSEGVSSTHVAAQAGVHRNTIAHWRRNYLPFREALAQAQYDRAIFFREKAEEMVELAYQTLHNLLNDPKASPSVRLKAAMFIIEKATTPPPREEKAPLDIEKPLVSPAPPVTIDKNAKNAQNAQIVPPVHNNAQSAQTPFRRETPKVGRNEPCPCGSGQKHKHCCLNHPRQAAAA